MFEVNAGTIVELRKRMGFSQKDLATHLGVDVSTVARWEQDKARPSGTAEAVLKALVGAIVVGAKGTSLITGCLSAYAVFNLLRAIFEGHEGKSHRNPTHSATPQQ
jgi:transcriptional regulator with XRE-family HTH domain